jgi:hypothetical protein
MKVMGNSLMRQGRLVCFALLALVPLGCRSAASTNPDDYVGEYVFRPSNASPGNFASFVILKNNQVAVEIRFSKSTGEVETTQKKWYLTRTTAEHVVIDDFSHPVEGMPPNIKLVVDGDLDQYYEKVR